MDKQLNVLYFSATGTTAKVVKEITGSIGNNCREYDITLPANREEEVVFGPDDVLIVGVPVYAGRIPGFLPEYLMKIKGHNTPAVFVAVYGNGNYDDALLELKDIFEKNGFIGIAGGTFIGEHSYTSRVGTGRPDAGDLKTAAKFGAEIRNKLESYEDILHLPKLAVKGSFPYKERRPSSPMAPETDDRCTSCGICAKHCPMGAIDLDNFKNVDAEKCIHCCSCVKRCPVNAKSINHEAFNNISQWLINSFGAVRREPEYFI